MYLVGLYKYYKNFGQKTRICYVLSGDVFAERLSSICRVDTITDTAGQGLITTGSTKALPKTYQMPQIQSTLNRNLEGQQRSDI